MNTSSVTKMTDCKYCWNQKCIAKDLEDPARFCRRMPNMFSKLNKPLIASWHRVAWLGSIHLYTSGRPWPSTHTGQRLDISSDIFCTHIPPSPLGLSVRDKQWGLPLYQGTDFIKVELQPWLNYRSKCRINALATQGANWCQKKMLVSFSGQCSLLIILPLC